MYCTMSGVRNTIHGSGASTFALLRLYSLLTFLPSSFPEKKSGKGRFIKVKKPGAENTEDEDKHGLPQESIWP